GRPMLHRHALPPHREDALDCPRIVRSTIERGYQRLGAADRLVDGSILLLERSPRALDPDLPSHAVSVPAQRTSASASARTVSGAEPSALLFTVTKTPRPARTERAIRSTVCLRIASCTSTNRSNGAHAFFRVSYDQCGGSIRRIVVGAASSMSPCRSA